MHSGIATSTTVEIPHDFKETLHKCKQIILLDHFVTIAVFVLTNLQKAVILDGS
jgi:hypothetical protein